MIQQNQHRNTCQAGTSSFIRCIGYDVGRGSISARMIEYGRLKEVKPY